MSLCLWIYIIFHDQTLFSIATNDNTHKESTKLAIYSRTYNKKVSTQTQFSFYTISVRLLWSMILNVTTPWNWANQSAMNKKDTIDRLAKSGTHF